jgi:tRNA G10  N-methylase Trm11
VIVTDPPYGIRAGAKKSGNTSLHFTSLCNSASFQNTPLKLSMAAIWREFSSCCRQFLFSSRCLIEFV